mgnify:CR=1 FL=1
MSDTTTQTKPIVMVVDDDFLATKAVVQLLERQGYTMVSAGSGPECLRILAEGLTPDVWVLDVKMPEMCALDVCRTIRSDARRGDLVVEARLVLPKVLDERSKELLREFGRINSEDVRASRLQPPGSGPGLKPEA